MAKNVGGRPKKEDKKPGQKIVQVSKDEHATKTAHKVAQLFNTNRTYVNQAVKMKEQATAEKLARDF